MKLGCICGCFNRFEYEAAEAEATGIPRALGYLRRLLDNPRGD